MIIAITIQREDQSHILVACIVFHPDNNVGSFVPYMAVLNEGTDKSIRMNDQNFVFPKGRESAIWRLLDISRFLLSMVQITATLLYRRKQERVMPKRINEPIVCCTCTQNICAGQG
jgi:hypothetical protein